MKRMLLALLLVAPPLLGAPVALTNTRYGEAAAETAVLATNGRDPFVLWKSRTTINITRLVEGESRVGRPVFTSAHHPDLVWTGQYFLAVADSGTNVVGRVLDANGDPVGGAFTIAENGRRPRIAWNGTNALLVYARGESVLAMLLTETGVPVNGGSITLATNAVYDVASNGDGFAAITASHDEVRVTPVLANGSAGQRATVSTFELEPGSLRTVAIGSDGSGYLAVWSTLALYTAVPVNADGTAGSPFNIARLPFEEQRVKAASVAWTGSDYAAAFLGGANNDLLFVARTSTHAVQSLSEGRPASGGGAVSLLRLGERTLMTWQPASGEPLLLAEASEPEQAVPVTFAAAQQEIGAAVSSRTATLVAWTEIVDGESSVRVGLRDNDGSWVERRIDGVEEALQAATDGSRFLLLARTPEVSMSAFLIDAQGNVISRAPLPLSGKDHNATVAWNGHDFAVAYINNERKAALARVSGNGAASPPQTFPVHTETLRTSVVANGTNFLFTWNDREHFLCFPPCDGSIEQVLAVRFGPDFTAIDPAPMVLATDDAFLVGTVAREDGYEVYWTTEKGLTLLRVPGSGPLGTRPRGTEIRDTEDLAGESEYIEVASYVPAWRAVWPRFGTQLTRVLDFRVTTIPTPLKARDMITMPDGRLAWVGVDVQEAAPWHGAQRVMLDVPEPAAAVPDAPLATLTYDGHEMTIDWIEPIRPVAGYRVEYRIGDGSWNELPRQYAADERSATWTSITRGRTYAFRVRAFSEAGAGAYSNVVSASARTGQRRRSVR
jgi:Fibronectin type III domain